MVALRYAPDRWRVLRAGAVERGWVPLSGFLDLPAGSNPFGVDGHKTIAYELVADLGSAPDVGVVPAAYGDGLAGIHRGFADLVDLGVIPAPRVPARAVADLRPSVAFSVISAAGAARCGWPATKAFTWRHPRHGYPHRHGGAPRHVERPQGRRRHRHSTPAGAGH